MNKRFIKTYAPLNLLLVLSMTLIAFISTNLHPEVSQAKFVQQPSALNCITTSVFEDNFDNNLLSNWQATSSTISIDNNALKVNINLIAPTDVWSASVATSNEISLTTGTYRLVFAARAGSNIERNIRVHLQENDNPDFPDRWSATSKLSTTLTTYSYDFLIAKPSVNDAPNLIFDLAQTNGDVWIDNIKLCKLDGNLPPNPSSQSSCIRFQDEFSSASFSPVTGTIPSWVKWVNQVPGIDSAPSDNKFQSPWGAVGPNSFTKEAYRSNNVTWNSASGTAVITAEPMPAYNWVAGANNYTLTYASGILQTNRTFTFTPSGNSGYLVEANIKLPNTTDVGFFPAFWMMRSFPAGNSVGGLWPPEIDIMEAYSEKPDSTYHTDFFTVPANHLGALGSKLKGIDIQQRRFQNATNMFDGNFHKYSLKWTSTEIIWYVDGAEVYRSNSVVVDPMYLLLNLQVGSPEGQVPMSNTVATMDVDYVRVYDLQCLNTNPTATPIPTSTPTCNPIDRTGVNWVASGPNFGNALLAGDGNLNSYWNSGQIQNTGQYFGANLPAVRSVSGISLNTTADLANELRSYIVKVSVDGGVFTPVATGTVAGSGIFTVTFPLTQVQYLSIQPNGTYTQSWSIGEFNICGAGVAPTATSTLTSLPTATQTNTPIPPTPTKTNTPIPPTATKTNTPVPPTATKTNTPTPTAVPVVTVDLIKNGSFTMSQTNWGLTIYSTTFSSASWAVNSQTVTGFTGVGNFAKITVTKALSNTDWHVRLEQSVPITVSKLFTVTFKASAKVSAPIALYVADANGVQYTLSKQFTLTTSSLVYTHSFTVSATTTATLQFAVGKTVTSYYFDDISLKTTSP